MPFGDSVDLSDDFHKRHPYKWYRNALTCYLTRLILSVMVLEKTFHPDERNQGTDIAYKMAFGKDVDVVTTWEWMEQYALRNTLYPAFLSIPLHIIRLLGIDYNWLVQVTPLCMNAILQFIGDYYGFKLTERLINKKVAIIFLSYSLCNNRINEVFQRTMTNGAEASFVVVALYHLSKLQFV